MNDNNCLNAALQYASRGFQVFPVNPQKKQPHKAEKYTGTKWGKTTDPAEIEKDWRKWPDANVGIATGAASGFWVIDLDVKDDGIRQWERFTAGLMLPETVTVTTPTGGRHYWWK